MGVDPRSRERIKPSEWAIGRPDNERLIDNLDHYRFALREQAEKDLHVAGEKLPLEWLSTTHGTTASEEVRTRLGRIIVEREKTPDLATRRLHRVVQAIELMKAPEAKRLLEEWAKQPVGLPSIEAKKALLRLASSTP